MLDEAFPGTGNTCAERAISGTTCRWASARRRAGRTPAPAAVMGPMSLHQATVDPARGSAALHSIVAMRGPDDVPLNIMLVESRGGAAEDTVAELTAAGHRVHRCHEHGA